MNRQAITGCILGTAVGDAFSEPPMHRPPIQTPYCFAIFFFC